VLFAWQVVSAIAIAAPAPGTPESEVATEETAPPETADATADPAYPPLPPGPAPGPAAEPIPETVDAPAPDPPAPVPDACPCEDYDWQCMQSNVVACDWNAERSNAPPSTTPRQPSVEPPPRPEPPPRFDGPQRRGVVLGFGAGYWGCRSEYCDHFRGGGMVMGEIGYRFNHIAPIMVAGGGGGKVDDDVVDTKLRMAYVQVGALVFFAPRTIFDPFAGVTIGWDKVVAKVDSEDYAGSDVSRGSVRLTLGFNFFVRPRFTIGPRFDLAIPFGGRICYGGGGDCFEPDELEAEGIDPAGLPKVFGFGLALRWILPPNPPRAMVH
jgi:hypothetical protein